MPRDTWCNLSEAKRERIVRASMVEFGSKGFSAGSLNVIAREAGVSKGSLFQYFDDKLDLFATVCEAAAIQIETAVLDGVTAGEQPFFEFVRDLVRVWVRFYSEHPVHKRMAYAMENEIDGEARSSVRSVANRHYGERLRPFVDAGLADGAIRPASPADEVLAVLVMMLRHLIAAIYDPEGDPWLALHGRRPEDTDAVLMNLVDAYERAYSTKL